MTKSKKHIFPVLLALCLTALTGSAIAGLPSNFHNFPQIGNGGSIRTVIQMANPGDNDANVTLSFRDQTGEPLELEINGTTASEFNLLIPARGSRILTTSGTGEAVTVGWAELISDQLLAAQVLFEIRNAEGALVTQAAVEDLGPLGAADLIVNNTEGQRVGLALVNLADAGAMRVVITLLDQQGDATGQMAQIDMEPGAQRAFFLDEVIANLGDFQGVAQIRASGSFAAVALQQQTNAVLSTLGLGEIF